MCEISKSGSNLAVICTYVLCKCIKFWLDKPVVQFVVANFIKQNKDPLF